MRYILDMVHHNPGEPPFQTRFSDPAHLVDYGFNGQVFKHINCIATFAATGVDCFPPGSPERAWLDAFTPGIEREIARAKAQGLKVFYHLDLFVLPRRLVEHFQEEICDPATGRIRLDHPRTLELHAILFAELYKRFPQVDGYIIRVGETYLFDTPHHVGNSPIPRLGPAWTPDYLYAETLAGEEPAEPRWSRQQVDAYVKLLRFLREEICVRHGQQVFFRTWDIFPDKLHARPDHYLEVVNEVEPHPRLAFSIKHTALDFWRRVKVNECLGQGEHPQIIEVQCQREYEGKGAYPNYVMDGVINGFEENLRPAGLKDWLANPKIVGVYSWSRGGGWYGPYLQNELWPDLNAYVLAGFVKNPNRPESAYFREYARERLSLPDEAVEEFRQLCLLSAQAVLLGRHCAVFDAALAESVLPTVCWMRDDRLGGEVQLKFVLDYLRTRGLEAEALAEKLHAVRLWEQIQNLAEQLAWPDRQLGEVVTVSVAYGRLLFSIIHEGWRALIAGAKGDRTEFGAAAAQYEHYWHEYLALQHLPGCASLYEGRYFNLPGTPVVPGLDASIEGYRQQFAQPEKLNI